MQTKQRLPQLMLMGAADGRQRNRVRRRLSVGLQVCRHSTCVGVDMEVVQLTVAQRAKQERSPVKHREQHRPRDRLRAQRLLGGRAQVRQSEGVQLHAPRADGSQRRRIVLVACDLSRTQ